MAIFYNWDEDREFGDAIWDYQKNGDINPLEKWLEGRNKITDIKYISELLFQVFMVNDCYFINGTSPFFTKAFKICENKLPTNIFNEICPNVWFESPQDFKNLFDAFDLAFCNDRMDGVLNRQRHRTVSECFAGERLDSPKGFWQGVKGIYSSAFFQKTNLANLNANVNTWLSKVPDANKFLEPYCLPIKGDVSFPHIAYAYLKHGMEIEKEVLGLYPTSNPQAFKVFKKASDFYELEHSLLVKEKKSLSKLKL